jgi:hypothetical protein
VPSSIVIYSTLSGAAGKIGDHNAGADIAASLDGIGMTGFRVYGSTAAASGTANFGCHYYASATLV